jgi:hypothetical protein
MFIAFMLTLVSMLAATFSPPAAIIMMLVGVGVSYSIGLIAITMQAMVGLVLVGAIIIWRIRQ